MSLPCSGYPNCVSSGGAGSNGSSGSDGFGGGSGGRGDGSGGGIGVVSGDVLLHNTLIAGNPAGDVSGSLDSASDYSLIGDGSRGLSTANHNLLGSSSSPLDPLLAPLGNYGGPTQTMALLPGSPAIDAGSNAYVTPGETDQRGDPRISGPSVDIGAYEFQQQSPQTNTFNPLPDPTYGYPDFALTATASSGLSVSYAATGNASVYQDKSGNWFAHITGAGMATITASQAGNNAYLAAPDVSQTFTISPAQINYTIGNDTQDRVRRSGRQRHQHPFASECDVQQSSRQRTARRQRPGLVLGHGQP